MRWRKTTRELADLIHSYKDRGKVTQINPRERDHLSRGMGMGNARESLSCDLIWLIGNSFESTRNQTPPKQEAYQWHAFQRYCCIFHSKQLTQKKTLVGWQATNLRQWGCFLNKLNFLVVSFSSRLLINWLYSLGENLDVL